MKKVDLHIHTTFSDGGSDPATIVVEAHKLGLSAISITDHNTVDGVYEAQIMGKELDIEIIPGIEITTMLGFREAHILGYYVDICDHTFLDFLKYVRECNVNRVHQMFNQLIESGLDLDYKEITNLMDSTKIRMLCREHVAWAVYKAGYVEEFGDALTNYLSQGTPGWVESKISPYDALREIKKNGGISSLAHPGFVGDSTEFLRMLMKEELMGVEVYHSGHTPEQQRKGEKIARELGLLMTGGSDFHGFNLPDICPKLGQTAAHYGLVEELKLTKENIDRGPN